MTTKVYGASDDLIEIEGDILDEVGCSSDKGALLVFSDGTVARIVYGEEGIWKITALRKGELFKHILICEDEEADPHSDQLVLLDGIKWVYVTKQWERVS